MELFMYILGNLLPRSLTLISMLINVKRSQIMLFVFQVGDD